jgi:hypothetical protein
MKLVAAALMLGITVPAMAAPPDWYVAAPRFHSCDPVSSDFTGLHTPEQVRDLYGRIGTHYDIYHMTATVTLLIDRLDENSRLVFFADRGACETELAKNAHFYDPTDIPSHGYKSY